MRKKINEAWNKLIGIQLNYAAIAWIKICLGKEATKKNAAFLGKIQMRNGNPRIAFKHIPIRVFSKC